MRTKIWLDEKGDPVLSLWGTENDSEKTRVTVKEEIPRIYVLRRDGNLVDLIEQLQNDVEALKDR